MQAIDQEIRQYSLDKGRLLLRVKPASLILRGVLLVMVAICVLAIISGIVAIALSGEGIKFGYVFGAMLLGLLGFFFLRMFLWNSFGVENLIFEEGTLTYWADYKWFKDGQRIYSLDNSPVFNVVSIGYEEDECGCLQIVVNKEVVSCVTKLPLSELEELAEKLRKMYPEVTLPND